MAVIILFCLLTVYSSPTHATAAHFTTVAATTAAATTEKNTSMTSYRKPTEEELKNRLSQEQYQVTQACGTERAFHNLYWNHHEAGIYVDIVSGEPLFSSLDKYDSGSGWPSFTQPIQKDVLIKKTDNTHGMERVEVKSKHAQSHLGHVFDDGPLPNKTRYCINSAALRFVPVAELEQAGYGVYLPLFRQVAIFAGGCFWGMEDILRKIKGVISTRVGYTGGSSKDPVYNAVKTGTTGHAEAVEVVFDPSVIGYEQLLGYFFRMHDPTTPNRQGNDIGTQYRSAIFYMNDQQKQIAQQVKESIHQQKKWPKPIVTEIVPFTTFYPAEEYHQKYLQKNPGGYSCHFLR